MSLNKDMKKEIKKASFFVDFEKDILSYCHKKGVYMITKDEWDKLKDNERFGMIIHIMKDLDKLRKDFDEHIKVGDYCAHTTI